MSLNRLLAWFKDCHIAYDADLIELRGDPSLYSGEGLGIFARKDVPEKAVLASIPKAAVLSVQNTSLAAFLKENRIGGGLGLVFSLMHEAALGEASAW